MDGWIFKEWWLAGLLASPMPSFKQNLHLHKSGQTEIETADSSNSDTATLLLLMFWQIAFWKWCWNNKAVFHTVVIQQLPGA